MDNSGRREAPITFFFLIEFCFIQDILPQGSPDRKVNNIRKGFLVIHRLWMSLLVVSSGIFFWIYSANSMNLVGKLNEFAPSLNISFDSYTYLLWALCKFYWCANQFTLLGNSIYFAQQFNLFSSAIQFTLLSNVTSTNMQHAIYKHITWLFNNTEKTGLLKPSISDNAKRYDPGDRSELPLHLLL